MGMQMTRVSWIAVGVALAAGFSAGIFAGPKLLPPAPANPNLVDLSPLPKDLRDLHRNEAFLKSETKNFEAGQERMAKEMAKRVPLDLPAGVSALPFSTLYKPGENVHWPEGLDGELGEAMEQAQSGWVIVNYWASWCAPCVHELPELGEAAPLYAEKGIALLVVNVDPSGGDTPETVQQVFETRGVRNIAPLRASGAQRDIMLQASGQNPMQFSMPMTVIYAPGGVPYAVFSGGRVEGDSKVWTAQPTLEFLSAMVARS